LEGADFETASAADRVIVMAPAAAPFSLQLSCDTGELLLLDLVGFVGAENASLIFEYPQGSQVCHWEVEATGEWHIWAK